MQTKKRVKWSRHLSRIGAKGNGAFLISAKLGHFLDKPLEPYARKVSISPNVITVGGFCITVLAAVVLPQQLQAAGILILLGGLFDMIDGVVARTNGKASKFGALLDSTLDRYSDAALLLGAAAYFYGVDHIAGAALSLGTLVGSLLVSYVRARAEGLGIACHVGIMERPERIVLLAFGCFTGWMFPVMIVLFVLSHVTVLQRILHVFRHR